MKIILIAILGALSFLLVVDPRILNPQYVAWIPAGDSLQNYLGWALYRFGPSTLPWGLSPNYGLEISSSIVYSDSIPIVAMFFKAFNRILPHDFQYFGIWYLLCFLLQAYFGYKIAEVISTKVIQRLLITILFIFSPAFLCTINVNPPLSAHFFLLAAIYLSIRSNDVHRFLYWLTLLILSAGVMFYIFVPVALIWLADILDRCFTKKEITLGRFFTELVGASVCLFFLSWFMGYFSIVSHDYSNSLKTMGPGGYGYAIWSLNLASLVYSGNWSLFSKLFGDPFNVDTGFNYLGYGYISLIFIFFYVFLRKTKKDHDTFFIKNIFLVLMLVALTLFSITNNVGIGNFRFTIPLMDQIISFASILRSSSRIFWVVNYFILTGLICYIGRRIKGNKFTLILFVSAILQLGDTSWGWIRLKNSIGSPQEYPHLNSFSSQLWDCEFLRANFDRIYRVPAIDYDQSWEAIGSLAAKCNIPTNFVLLNRPDRAKIQKFNSNFRIEMKSNKLGSRNLYLIEHDYVPFIRLNMNENIDFFGVIDGRNVYIPDVLNNCKLCKKFDSNIPRISAQLVNVKPKVNVPIRFGKNDAGVEFLYGIDQAKNIGWGWSFPEEWGVWSNGGRAIIGLEAPDDFDQGLLVINLRSYGSQSIAISINGAMMGHYQLSDSQENLIKIPLKLAEGDKYIGISFSLPNARSPKESDIGSSDDRKLAIGVHSICFVE